MRVILDIESINHPLTGIGRYTLTLTRELLKSPRVTEVGLIKLADQMLLTTPVQLEAYIEQIIPTEIRAVKPEDRNNIEYKHVPFWRYIPFWDSIPYRKQIPFREAFIRHYNNFKYWRLERRYRQLELFKFFSDQSTHLLEGWQSKFNQKQYKNIVNNKSLEYIFHGPNFHLALMPNKSVVTIHDLSVLRHPECHPEDRTDFWNKEIYKVAERSTKIITVSEFQKQEIIELLGVDADKIHVVYLGVESKFRPYNPEDSQDVLQKYGLEYKQYSLVVSTIEPRKNFIRLLKAFEQLPKSMRRTYPLAIVGDKGWKSEEIHKVITGLIEKKEAVRLGYVDEADLPYLYASAAVFLYPSIYEGFGLPVLEAMASGTPVLTSNTSSLPEVAGEGCLLIDPYSIEDITTAWQNILGDLALREELSEAGIIQAKKFSWQRCAQQTIEVYEKAER